MTEPARVLWLVNGLGRGGAEQLLLSLARTIDQSRVHLEVAYLLSHKNALVQDLSSSGVIVHSLSDTSAPWPFVLRRLLDEGRFSVVHTHSPLVGAFARALTPRGSTLVHTEHNVWARYRWPTRLLNALTIHLNEVVWAVSQGVADSIRPVFVAGKRPAVQVLVHGLGLQDHLPGPPDRAEALGRLGLSPGPFTIGTVGNLTPKKDHGTLIAALGLLRTTHQDCRLVLLGGGPREEPLRRLVHDQGLTDAVTFAGRRDDVPHLLAAFDVFAMSSRYEGLSIALLEAMAAGLPVVVTAAGGLPEVVTDGTDGLVVPTGDPHALCDALETMLVDAQRRTAFGAAAQARAADFGIEPAAETMTHTYLDLAARQGALTS